MPKFIVKLADQQQAEFYSDGDDIFIGRVPTINDICVNDPSVSRQHAHLKKREEGYTVYDLKSLNGLFLNGARISRALVQDGDVIRLGEVEIEIRFRDYSSEEALEAIERSEQTAAQFDDRTVDEVTKRMKIPTKPE